MAIEEKFEARITVRDEMAAALRAIGARFAALAQQTGLARIGQAAAGVGQAFGRLALQIGSTLGPLAALGGAAGIAGLTMLATSAAGTAGALSDLSARTGVSVAELQSLGDVARLSGVSQDTLASSLQRLNRGLAEAANGGGGDLANVLRHLGINMRDATGQIRPAVDLLPQLADAFARNENQALRVRLATELFGKAGEALIPMLQGGAAAITEARGRFERFGYSLGAVAEDLAKADDQFEGLQVAVEGLGMAIGARLAPILGPLAERMADWVAANRDLIATRIGDWAQQVSESLSRFFADTGPLERLAEFGSTIVTVVAALGGIQNVLLGFGALAAAPFIAALVSIGGALLPLLSALGSLALALGAASPVGLAIIAFGAAAALLIANWEPVAAFFTGLWDGITAAFQRAYDAIRPIAEAIGGLVARITGGGSPTGAVAAPAAQEQRRANQRGRGVQRIEGFGDPAGLPRSPLGAVLPASPLAAAGAAPAQQGQVEVTVNLNNAPPGTRVETETAGGLVAPAQTNVGYALGRPQ